MGGNRIKIEKKLATHEIAAFLRMLADEVEGKGGVATNEFGWELHDFNKLKIGLIKEGGGQLALSLKVKGQGQVRQGEAPAAPDFTDIGELEYRPFKREMKVTFVEIAAGLDQGKIPPEELWRRFMAQSKRLIAFSGFGDPFYNDYWQACASMDTAVGVGDLAACRRHWQTLVSLKRDCHRRYK